MPFMKGRDKKGPYIKWGDKGFPYHYKEGDKESEERARKKAGRQAEAIYAGGYKGK